MLNSDHAVWTFQSMNGCFYSCMEVFTQISSLLLPSRLPCLTNDLFFLSVCRKAKYRQREGRAGNKKSFQRKCGGPKRVQFLCDGANRHIKVICWCIRSRLEGTDKPRHTAGHDINLRAANWNSSMCRGNYLLKRAKIISIKLVTPPKKIKVNEEENQYASQGLLSPKNPI